MATDEQLEWLVKSYGSVLYKVAFAITRNQSLAEEVLQDAFFQAWQFMPSWDGDVPIRWMRRVTRNRAVSVVRKEGRSVANDEWDQRATGHPSVEQVVESRAALAAMDRALEELDEQSRIMLVMRETEDLTYEEIGELLDLTASAVKAKLYRARNTLKRRLKEWNL